MTESICLVKYGREPQKVHQGCIEKCFQSTETYAAFYGIAYAAPPDGTKLYQAPEPLAFTEPNTREEDQNRSTPQTSSATPGRSTSSLAAPNPTDLAKDFVKTKKRIVPPPFGDDEEPADCLYLNVFCPRDPKLTKELLPVLVFIHGRGFDKGSNDPENYSAEKIVQFDVVLVTINSRLGAYGFLNLRTKEVPGNAGLKDQVVALRWIRDNIAYFKGDPENVTISGWSAGATCVNCHLISPMSKGLFHKAIVQSGGIFWPWGYRGHRIEVKKSISADAECQSSLHDKEKSKELPKLALNIIEGKRNSQHPGSYSPFYGPTSEKEAEGAFLTGEIESIMKQAQPSVPVMAGIVTNEALHLFANSITPDYKVHIQIDDVLYQILMDNFRWSKDTAIENANRIRNKYFPSIALSSSIAAYRNMVNFVHDIHVNHFYDCFKFGPEKKVHEKLYVYRFEHMSGISVAYRKNMFPFMVAANGDDVNFLYLPTTLKREYRESIYEGSSQNKDILKVMNHMCSLWANFCKNGTPKSEFDSSVEWKPYTDEKPYYLSINSNLVLKKGSILSDKCIWLNKLVNSQPTIQSQKNSPKHE